MSTLLRNAVTDSAALRSIIGEPIPRIAAKARSALDADARSFIAASPFALIASCDFQGHLDISPKGDAPGFVRVLDDRTLAIPDRMGNRRADTFTNILELPRVALLFVVPGLTYTLRAAGTAAIVADDWLLGEMTVGGLAPKLALVVSLEEVFFHCPKCFVRSELWRHEAWPDVGRLSSFEQIRSRQPPT